MRTLNSSKFDPVGGQCDAALSSLKGKARRRATCLFVFVRLLKERKRPMLTKVEV